MLETRDVTVFRERSTVPAVESFTAIFAPGQISALTGDNGSGKTSLALVLVGALPRIVAGRWLGEIHLDGVALEQNGWPFGLTSVYASSEPGVDLLIGTVADLLDACHPAIRAVAQRLPLGDRRRPIRRLSAGQRRLLAWLLGAARRPAVLAVDEAFASLDTKTASILLNGMNDLPWMESTVMIAIAATSVEEMLPHGCGPIVALRRRPLAPAPSAVAVDAVAAFLQPVRYVAFDERVAAWWRYDRERKYSIRELKLHPGFVTHIRGEIGTGKTTVLKSIAGFPGTDGDGALKRLRQSAKPTYLGGSMYYVAGYERVVDFLDAEARQIVIALAASRLRKGSCLALATHSESLPAAISAAAATSLAEVWVESA